MEGFTIDGMSEKLGLSFKAVSKRVQTAGIKPLTRRAVYPYETLEAIRDRSMGRPKKDSGEGPDEPAEGGGG